jgi:hypothetical protein
MAIAEILRVTHSLGDNVRVVLDGTQRRYVLVIQAVLNMNIDGKDAKDVMQQTAHDIDEVKR